jgi:hypothetical protein
MWLYDDQAAIPTTAAAEAFRARRVLSMPRDLLRRTGSGSPAISRRGSRGDESGPQSDIRE